MVVVVHYVRGLLVDDLRRGREELIRTASFFCLIFKKNLSRR
jgi:hypothetical protein